MKDKFQQDQKHNVKFLNLEFLGDAANLSIRLAAAVLLLSGKVDIPTVTALAHILPILTYQSASKSNPKQLPEKPDRLHQ